MSEQGRRQLLSHAAVGASLCIGAYSFLVEPIHRRLSEAKAKQLEFTAELRPAEGVNERLALMKGTLEAAGREAAKIRDLSRPARDERSLFASMTALADACKVRIDQLTPTKLSTMGRDRGGAAGGQPGPAANSGDAAVGYTIAIVASYEDLVSFLRAIRSELGYSRVRSVKMLPLSDEKVKAVRALIETEHFAFDPSPPPPTDQAGAGGAPAAGGQP